MSGLRDQGPQAAMIAGGRKLHLQHGPIDLVIEVDGAPGEVLKAYRQATGAFQTVLVDLVKELPALRRSCGEGWSPGQGPVAQRMTAAVSPHCGFITPMAAVAGSVADHILERLISGRTLARTYVNNGGDIALYLGRHETFRIGICADPKTGRHASVITIASNDGIGGVATSGWQGRSQSLGVADAVTVLAHSAAKADAAATLIANAVDLPDSPHITRCPANELEPDSDLGCRLVTVDVAPLTQGDIAEALNAGETVARRMIEQGLIRAAFLTLQGTVRVAGHSQIQHVEFESPAVSRSPLLEPAHA